MKRNLLLMLVLILLCLTNIRVEANGSNFSKSTITIDSVISIPDTKPTAKPIDLLVNFFAHKQNPTFLTYDTLTTKVCDLSVTEVITHTDCKKWEPFGSITTSPTGGVPPYTYSWSNGQTKAAITGLHSGTYSLTVSDATGRCSITKSYFINPSLLSPLLVQSQDTLYAYPKKNQSNIPLLYSWDLNGELIAGVDATLDYYVVREPGDYVVYIMEDIYIEGCMGVSNVIKVLTTGIANGKEIKIRIRPVPNPSNGVLSVYFDTETITEVGIEIYDVMGKQLFKTQSMINPHDKIDIDTSSYGQGLYFLDIKDKQGRRNVIKIVGQ